MVDEQWHLVTQHLVMTEHLNPNHNIFGGQLLAWLDQDVYIFLANKLKYKKMVTFSLDNVFFRKPAHLGEIIQIYAKLEDYKKSRIVASGKAIAYDPETEQQKEIIECKITFIALDENGKPTRIAKDH